VITLPLCWLLFKNMPLSGYPFAKTFGLLLFGFVAWFLMSVRILPNTLWALVLVLLLLAALSVFIVRRLGWSFSAWREAVGHQIYVVEVLFLVLLSGYAVLRQYAPEIKGTEKFMDFMMLNSILQSSSMPPHDAWAGGLTINYYYFGYLIVAFLTRLTSIPSATTYNLALALFFALSGLGAYGIGYTLVKRFQAGGGITVPRTGTLTGLLAAFLLLFIGNLFTIWKAITEPAYLSQNFFFGIGWNATRVVNRIEGDSALDYTINEFPAFSFILGDLHPHVMALPFALLAIYTAFTWFADPDYPAWPRSFPPSREALPSLLTLPVTRRVALSAIVFGGLYFLNSWDFPTYFFLLVVCVLLSLKVNDMLPAWKDALGWVGATGVLSLVFFAPFYLTFDPPTQGIGLVPYRTDLGQFFTMFGIFLVPLGVLLVILSIQTAMRHVVPDEEEQIPNSRGRKARQQNRRADGGGADTAEPTPQPVARRVVYGPYALGIVAWLLGTLLLARLFDSAALAIIALSLVAGICFALWLRAYSEPLPLVLSVVGIATLLVLASEVLYVKDFYGPPNMRMNTVFKLYFQVWTLLAPVVAFTIYYVRIWLRERQRPLSWLFRIGTTLLVLSGLYYSLLTAPIYAVFQREPPTLDGTKYYQRDHPDEVAAIAWLQENASSASVVVEATGQEYSQYSRVSTFTGLQTVLGWRQHEHLWRNDYGLVLEREEDLKLIYVTAPREGAETFLRKYEADYIFIGDWERQLYGESVDRLLDWFPIVFQSGNVFVLKANVI
jgi:YYY domain-containing protein